MSKTQMVSSPWTLTLKLLLPTFWFCLFGGGLIVLLIIPSDILGGSLTPASTRMTMAFIVFSSLAVYYWLFYPLKWVGMDSERLYVSNFMKSFQYTYDSISKVEEHKLLFWNRVTIHFYEAGHFGKSISFFGSYYWHYYLKKNPKILEMILETNSKTTT